MSRLSLKINRVWLDHSSNSNTRNKIKYQAREGNHSTVCLNKMRWGGIPWQSSCLRLSTSTPGGMGSIPGQGAKIPHALHWSHFPKKLNGKTAVEDSKKFLSFYLSKKA